MAKKQFKNFAITPKKCHLWQQENPKPELEIIKKYPLYDHTTTADDSSRSLRKCITCGQLYFYEMTEFIDMQEGEDPIFRTYIPVASIADANSLSQVNENELYKHTPQIMFSWPSGEDKSIGWVRAQSAEKGDTK
jgi:hypothetical protein